MTTMDIRGFSTPVFRFDLVPVFLDTIKDLCVPDWTMVRERMYTEKADQMMDAMIIYKDAFLEREVIEKKWYGIKKTYPLDTASQELYQEVQKKREQERVTYKTLCELLTDPPYETHTEDWRLALRLMN